MDALSNVNYWIERGKTPAGQYRTKHPEAKTTMDEITDVGTGIATYAPFAAAGPFAPPLFGAMALGGQRVQARERAMNLTTEELDKLREYPGQSDDELRENLYTKGTDLTKLSTWGDVLPSVAGNVIGGGMLGQMTKGFMRTQSGAITDRILKKVTEGTGAANFFGRRAISAVEGGVGGAARGAGGAYTQRATDVSMGLRPSVDYGEVGAEGVKQGLVFGAIGTLTHRRVAPIGTDTKAVAGERTPPPPRTGLDREG